MTPEYCFVDFRAGKLVHLLNFVKENGIRMVYWDLGGTLVDIPDDMKERIINKINRLFRCNINLNLYNRAVSNEWKDRETRTAQKAIKAVNDEKKEKAYWIEFYTCVLRRLEIGSHSTEKEAAELVKWLATVQTNPKSFELCSYVEETLASLDELGIPVGIISNAFPSARKILETSGLIQKFNKQHIILSYEYNSIKPERAIYRKAIKNAKVKLGEILFIDDRKSFVKGAERNGIKAILIEKETPDQGILNYSENNNQELVSSFFDVENEQSEYASLLLNWVCQLSSFLREIIIWAEDRSTQIYRFSGGMTFEQ